MTDFLTSIDSGKATFRDYVTQPAFADELETYVTAGNDTGMHDHIDIDYFLERVLNGQDWEDDKFSLEYLADHLEFYGKYFHDLCDMAPVHAVTLDQAKAHAKAMGELIKARQHVARLENDLRSKRRDLDEAA